MATSKVAQRTVYPDCAATTVTCPRRGACTRKPQRPAMPTVRRADHIFCWLEVLREDNRAIVRAASQASKATEWLLGLLPEHARAEHEIQPSADRRVA